MELARLVQEDDLPVCAELLRQAVSHARAMRGGAALVGTTSSDEVLGRWTSVDSGKALFVGEFHQAVVGLASAATFTRPGAGGLTGRIDCCYVEEAARGVGVGTALMEAVVDWCAGQGCRDIDALALPGDRSSKQRLEAAGFTARLLTLNRQLG